jgi:hypothetical protein
MFILAVVESQTLDIPTGWERGIYVGKAQDICGVLDL